MKPYIYFEDDDTGCYSQKLSEEVSRVLVFQFVCSMNERHHLDYIVLTTDNSMMKIGQYPSVADMTIPEIKKYRTILGRQYRDYSKAVGLFANGIGIGSYVYLRRIIENLVFDKFSQVSGKLDISEECF